MDRILLSFLSFGLFCYILGIAIRNKPFSFLKRYAKLRTIYEYSDWTLLIVSIIITFGTSFYFWLFKSNLPDAIQLGIFFATFFTLLYSIVIKDKPSRYRNRPKIKVLFNPNKTDFYHRTVMHIFDKNGKLIAIIPTYYVRLKVKNIGKRTLKNVEVVLETVSPKPTKPFMSLNLNWAGFNVPIDIKRSVDIPQGQSRTLDVFEFLEFPSTMILFDNLTGAGDPEAERYKELAEGFRSCTIKPLTRSDIFPRGNYVFRLGIYANNVKPKFKKIFVKYEGNWIENTSLEEMRSEHLIVKVT